MDLCRHTLAGPAHCLMCRVPYYKKHTTLTFILVTDASLSRCGYPTRHAKPQQSPDTHTHTPDQIFPATGARRCGMREDHYVTSPMLHQCSPTVLSLVVYHLELRRCSCSHLPTKSVSMPSLENKTKTIIQFPIISV